MIKAYRVEKDESIIHDLVCHDCAAKKLKEGFELMYDLALSERTPEYKAMKQECEICGGTLFVDGRKKYERLCDSYSLCF